MGGLASDGSRFLTLHVGRMQHSRNQAKRLRRFRADAFSFAESIAATVAFGSDSFWNLCVCILQLFVDYPIWCFDPRGPAIYHKPASKPTLWQ